MTPPPPTDFAKVALLEDLGVFLFGAHWHGRMAQALKVNPRTITRWLYGERGRTWPIPDRVWGQLAEIFVKRQEAACRFQASLASLLAPKKCSVSGHGRAESP